MNTKITKLAATKTNPAISVVFIDADGVMEILSSPAREKFLRKLNGWAIAHDARSYYRTEDADMAFVWDVRAELMDTSGRSGESAVDLEEAKIIAGRFTEIMSDGVSFKDTYSRWTAKIGKAKPFWTVPACPEWDGDDDTLADVLRPVCRSFRLAKASAADF